MENKDALDKLLENSVEIQLLYKNTSDKELLSNESFLYEKEYAFPLWTFYSLYFLEKFRFDESIDTYTYHIKSAILDNFSGLKITCKTSAKNKDKVSNIIKELMNNLKDINKIEDYMISHLINEMKYSYLIDIIKTNDEHVITTYNKYWTDTVGIIPYIKNLIVDFSSSLVVETENTDKLN